MIKSIATTSLIALACVGCGSLPTAPGKGSFEDDVAFVERSGAKVIVLRDSTSNARVAVVPEYQGRALTSASGGPGSAGYGWINRKLIKSRKIEPHMNPYGGEDRFWMGPEGGQFAIFFPPGAPFDFEHWQTPPIIDTEPFDIASVSDTRA